MKGPEATKTETFDLKEVLTELHVSALNRAKAENKIAVDLLARLAVIKFLRAELQHNTVRCWNAAA